LWLLRPCPVDSIVKQNLILKENMQSVPSKLIRIIKWRKNTFSNKLCSVGEKHSIKDRQSLKIEKFYYFSIGCFVLYMTSIPLQHFPSCFKNELVTLVLNERIFTVHSAIWRVPIFFRSQNEMKLNNYHLITRCAYNSNKQKSYKSTRNLNRLNKNNWSAKWASQDKLRDLSIFPSDM